MRFLARNDHVFCLVRIASNKFSDNEIIGSSNGSSRLRGDTARKVFMYSLCVTLAFIATTSPLTVYYIFKPTIVLFIVSEAILPLNGVLNTIVYFLRGRSRTRSHATRIHTFEQTLEETRF